MPSPSPSGLSSADAQARLAADGPNELPQARSRGWLTMVGAVLREPMLLALLACGALYIVIGDAADALLLMAAVLVVIAITVVQERRTETALAALRVLAAPLATVLRDGQRRQVPARELVAGDCIVLGEGERVPADVRVLDATLLAVDESLLTGESVAVNKAAGSSAEPDDSQRLFAGTLVTRGRATALVEATGPRSQMGRIGEALATVQGGSSPLQAEAALLVRRMGLAGLVVCVLVAGVYGLQRGDWFGALLAGVSLAMGMMPEEVPVVMAVFTALGAWRLARQRVLARNLASVETLGSASVLAVDKTGTLTENRMRLQRLVTAQGESVPVGSTRLPPSVHRLAEVALLATPTGSADPMERAIERLALDDLIDAAHLHNDWQLLREYPLAPELLAMSRVWQAGPGGPRLIAAKGAPEAIAQLCHLPAADWDALRAQIDTLADQGLRVLAVASARLTHAQAELLDGAAPHGDGQHAYAFELLGLLALADPLRAGVPQALALARDAGIRVLMITGDHPATARAIGREAGFGNAPGVLTGTEIDQLDDDALATRLLGPVQIVARAVPAHKLRIVQALRAKGEVVAMTGDGINDAPALKAADIGLAMGARGTDVAREAADLVIADDDFSSIVAGVRMGRRIDRNLLRAMAFVIAVHVPLAGLTLLAVLAGWPLLLLPADVALLELIIDPACSIVFEVEPVPDDALRQPPRRRGAALLSGRILWISLAMGLLVCVVIAAAAAWSRQHGWSEQATRGLAFGLLVSADLALIGALLRPQGSLLALLRGGNTAWWVALAGTLLGLALLQGIPAAAGLFHMATATPWEVLVIAAGSLCLLVPLRWLSRRLGQ
ncbi:MAG: cation-translocating P-type ATPase [Burkholderiales bacterium]